MPVDANNPKFPSFDELPYRKGDPGKACWGFWPEDDNLGMLNLLTPERILEAKKEIETGLVVSLNWRLQNPEYPGFGREPIKHRVFPTYKGKPVNDDELTFNTQSGSQWDGFRHWGLPDSQLFWNGQHQDEIVNGKPTIRNSLHIWAERGIVGRGVLLDYRSWAVKNGKNYDACRAPAHRINVADLDKVAKDQGVELRMGDILFLRTGYIEWYNNSETEERIRVAKQYPPDIVGIEQTEASIRWLWDHHFSAVAADNTSVELRPTMASWNIHDYLLPMWGTPVGELFDLEPLSEMCKKLGRYSFFVTSAPLNVMGGIACMARLRRDTDSSTAELSCDLLN